MKIDLKEELDQLKREIVQEVVEKLKPLIQNNGHDEIMTAKECAKHLKVPLSSIRKKTSRKEIPYFRLGEGTKTPVRYSRKAVDNHFRKYHTPAKDSPDLKLLRRGGNG